ncbi:MAG: hypothetical protein LBT88_01560 [Oscillospiraceae bacterium]|jgi:hypothetical protein|nr:hypothetical protein [Oscillospiraceae bacterium]
MFSKTKRFLSYVLAAALVLSLVSSAALAAPPSKKTGTLIDQPVVGDLQSTQNYLEAVEDLLDKLAKFEEIFGDNAMGIPTPGILDAPYTLLEIAYEHLKSLLPEFVKAFMPKLPQLPDFIAIPIPEQIPMIGQIKDALNSIKDWARSLLTEQTSLLDAYKIDVSSGTIFDSANPAGQPGITN